MSKIRVLFADEDPAFRVYARYTLEQMGFTVTAANDGADLIARFLPESYDVVLVSLNVPFLDGVQVLRAIKQRSAATPVILLCDGECTHLAEQGKQEGAFAYFVKPLHDFSALGRALEQAHAQRRTTVPALPTQDTFIQTLHALVESTRTRPLDEVLQLCLISAAQCAQTSQGMTVLAHANGFQVYSAFGFIDLDAARQEWVNNLGDAFGMRVLSAFTPLIESLPGVAGYVLGIPMYGSETSGVLVLYPLASAALDTTRQAQLEVLAAHGALALEFARLREENLRLAPTDPVTGVLKREAFLEMADREFRRSWRYNQPITAIIVDIDDLSTINLRYGYSLGNQVLQMTAQACVNIIRSIDLIGRYSGDAFAILLVMTEGEGARTVAERLRVGINALRPISIEGTIQITASLGVCSYPRSGCTSIFDLLTLAQEAQYAAHCRGANEIVYC
ncbi:MAG: GGDEF domain-containing response regulator [Anaerolineae bacterium]|nr:GGDEF domain-containing response regulator [Anaerolineae bacterium]